MRIAIPLLIAATGCASIPNIAVTSDDSVRERCLELDHVYVTAKSQYWADRKAASEVNRHNGNTLLLDDMQEIWTDSPNVSIRGVAYQCAGERQ
jgi:hypothetical protein